MRTFNFRIVFSVFFFAACFFLLFPASAQITFQKTFGGTFYDNAQCVRQTTDGGYIITGYTNSFGGGNYDIYLIKTNANGDALWTKTFGGVASDQGYYVQQTMDGGYIVSGFTYSFGSGIGDVYVIKTDANGDSLWTKTFGGTGLEWSLCAQQTADGGFIITGMTSSFGAGNNDVYLIRTDGNGDSLWTKTIGRTVDDFGYSVQQTSDGGFIITGHTGDDVYLVRADANGNSLWTKTLGGTANDFGFSAQQTSDGGYIIVGATFSFGTSPIDVYLIKTDTNGNPLWSKTFGRTGNDFGQSVQQTADGGYIIAGTDGDVYLIKTDTNGDSLWTKTYGSGFGYSVQQTADGGYIIAGNTNSFGAGLEDVYLIKTDANGNSGCNQGNNTTIITSPATQVSNPATIVTSPPTIVTTPATIVGSGGTVTTLCITVGIQSAINNPKFEISVSPNPSPGIFTITFTNVINNGEVQIYNPHGSKIFTQNIHNTSNTEIHLENIPGGIYLVKIWNGEKYFTNKIIIQQN